MPRELSERSLDSYTRTFKRDRDRLSLKMYFAPEPHPRLMIGQILLDMHMLLFEYREKKFYEEHPERLEKLHPGKSISEAIQTAVEGEKETCLKIFQPYGDPLKNTIAVPTPPEELALST